MVARRVAVAHRARLVIINRDETPYDQVAAEVIRADITGVVPDIVDQLLGARV